MSDPSDDYRRRQPRVRADRWEHVRVELRAKGWTEAQVEAEVEQAKAKLERIEQDPDSVGPLPKLPHDPSVSDVVARPRRSSRRRSTKSRGFEGLHG